MTSSCLIGGLPEQPLVDAEPWRYVLTLGTPAQGGTPATPFDLTGSDLAMTFRTRVGWEPVSNLSTLATWPGIDGALDGTITLTDPANGVVSIVSDPWLRAYRVPILGFGRVIEVPVIGDVLRLAKDDPDARPEFLGSISFPLRASTTQWRGPTS